MSEAPLAASYSATSVIEGEWFSRQWWLLLNEPQLNGLIERALQQNLTLQAAVARMHAADALITAAKASYLPEIGLGFAQSVTHYSDDSILGKNPTLNDPVAQTDFGFNFNYEVNFWGRNSGLVKESLGASKAAHAEAAQAELIVTTLVAKTYFELQQVALESAIYRNLHEEKKAQLELTQALFAQGIAPKRAINIAESGQLAIRAELCRLVAEEEALYASLSLLLGRGPDQPYALEFAISPLNVKIPIPANLPLDLIAHRPDITAMVGKMEAAAGALSVAKSGFFPSININALLGLSTLHIENLFQASNFTYGIAPAIHLPIFTGGKIRARYNSKRAAFEQAILEYNQHVLSAASEVKSSLTALTQFELQLEIQSQSLRCKEENLVLATERTLQGVDSLLTLLNSVESVQLELLKSIRFYKMKRLAQVSLIKSLGGGYDSSRDERDRYSARKEGEKSGS